MPPNPSVSPDDLNSRRGLNSSRRGVVGEPME